MDKWLIDAARMQATWMEAWMSTCCHAVEAWQHLWAANLQLFCHPAARRSHDAAPGGADWANHYGRRHRDVDVEHMR